MNDACRAANLQMLLSSSRVPPSMKELWLTFQQVFKSSVRGTCLSDAYAPRMPTEMKVIPANPMSRGRLKTVCLAYLPLAMEHTHAQSPEGK